VREHAGDITLGPVQFNWSPESWRDFYFRIADEAPVAAVYLGEVICSKRAPLFDPHYTAVAKRLAAAGKAIVFSTLSEVLLKLDRKLVESICAAEEFLVEANDASALLPLRGRAHHIGPFMNVYNEKTVGALARGGARNFCLPAEMPGAAIEALCESVRDLDVTIEVQVFGRTSLALSARCYHARAHGRTKDTCRFVCENDPDGMDLKTLDGRILLTVNGVQTLSFDYLNLIEQLPDLHAMGVSRFRLSPHSCDMVEVSSIFRSVLDGKIDGREAMARLDELKLPAPFSNGFYYGKPGHSWNKHPNA
jgi:O2-independent ubiquinone biosynthesis protein UbiV